MVAVEFQKANEMDTEKAIAAVEELKNLLELIWTVSSFNGWLDRAKNTLSICIPNVDFPLPMTRVINISGDVLSDYHKDKARTILDGHLSDLQRFGFRPKDKIESVSPVSLAVNQSNNQTQTTSVQINLDIFIEALKNELTGAQIKELKSILDSDEDEERKRKSFLDKLKGFGANVAANVLGNILANPNVLSGLSEML